MKRILSIDGGGIRGIVPATILVALEKKIQTLTGNGAARLSDFFDFFAGTSTGGILTSILLCPDENDPTKSKYSAEDALNLYKNFGNQIFHSNIWQKITTLGGLADELYNATPLENILEEYFANIRLANLKKPCIITAYDVERRSAFIFSQEDATHRQGYDFYLKDVCRATSAAPTYFELATIKSLTGVTYNLIDGGVFANNPALCAYTENKEIINPDTQKGYSTKDLFFVSLGTDVKRSEGYNAKKMKNWGALTWAKPLIDIMMAGVNDTTDFHLRSLFKAAQVPYQYHRLEANAVNNIRQINESQMDDASEENIEKLIEFGTEMAQSLDYRLNFIAECVIEPAKIIEKTSIATF
ncbi:MAG: patatin [Bacteroidetes bacterium]|nr:MAG: patatin [Bacteroidota bacterium]TAG92435.1 MAG: patatin [Bacteroidota bacterium]